VNGQKLLADSAAWSVQYAMMWFEPRHVSIYYIFVWITNLLFCVCLAIFYSRGVYC